ncbi:MAG: hypothetical protein LBV04_00770, partial [Deferribacteraceae bacterium]|nr:hypothetical protein [Deferribacteraceae bacterium]
RNASSGRSSFGSWRYYIAPKDILTLDDIPKAWGFIEYCNSRFYLRRESDLFERSQIYEYQYVSELLVRSEFLHDRLFHSYDRKGLRKVKISNKL